MTSDDVDKFDKFEKVKVSLLKPGDLVYFPDGFHSNAPYAVVLRSITLSKLTNEKFRAQYNGLWLKSFVRRRKLRGSYIASSFAPHGPVWSQYDWTSFNEWVEQDITPTRAKNLYGLSGRVEKINPSTSLESISMKLDPIGARDGVRVLSLLFPHVPNVPQERVYLFHHKKKTIVFRVKKNTNA